MKLEFLINKSRQKVISAGVSIYKNGVLAFNRALERELGINTSKAYHIAIAKEKDIPLTEKLYLVFFDKPSKATRKLIFMQTSMHLSFKYVFVDHDMDFKNTKFRYAFMGETTYDGKRTVEFERIQTSKSQGKGQSSPKKNRNLNLEILTPNMTTAHSKEPSIKVIKNGYLSISSAMVQQLGLDLSRKYHVALAKEPGSDPKQKLYLVFVNKDEHHTRSLRLNGTSMMSNFGRILDEYGIDYKKGNFEYKLTDDTEYEGMRTLVLERK